MGKRWACSPPPDRGSPNCRPTRRACRPTRDKAHRGVREDERRRMNDYFDGALGQLAERARQLSDLLPRNLGRDVHALEVICRDRLEKIGDRLRWLRGNADLLDPQNRPQRLRLLRRAWGDLSHLESVAV